MLGRVALIPPSPRCPAAAAAWRACGEGRGSGITHRQSPLCLPRAVRLQRCHRHLGQDDGTPAPGRLRLLELDSGLRLLDGPNDREAVSLEVHVLPPQREQFAAPHAGRDGEQDWQLESCPLGGFEASRPRGSSNLSRPTPSRLRRSSTPLCGHERSGRRRPPPSRKPISRSTAQRADDRTHIRGWRRSEGLMQ